MKIKDTIEALDKERGARAKEVRAAYREEMKDSRAALERARLTWRMAEDKFNRARDAAMDREKDRLEAVEAWFRQAAMDAIDGMPAKPEKIRRSVKTEGVT